MHETTFQNMLLAENVFVVCIVESYYTRQSNSGQVLRAIKSAELSAIAVAQSEVPSSLYSAVRRTSVTQVLGQMD